MVISTGLIVGIVVSIIVVILIIAAIRYEAPTAADYEGRITKIEIIQPSIELYNEEFTHVVRHGKITTTRTDYECHFNYYDQQYRFTIEYGDNPNKVETKVIYVTESSWHIYDVGMYYRPSDETDYFSRKYSQKDDMDKEDILTHLLSPEEYETFMEVSDDKESK